ncbi:MAG: AzlC family ABC transporter permease, partial [Catenibacterium mitsuokai]
TSYTWQSEPHGLARGSSQGWGWAVLMSIGIYDGSMQFVTINLLSTGASIITTAIMTLMVFQNS